MSESTSGKKRATNAQIESVHKLFYEIKTHNYGVKSSDTEAEALKSRMNQIMPDLRTLLSLRTREVMGILNSRSDKNTMVQQLADFLDLTLRDYLTDANEQADAQVLLSRVIASTQTVPRRLIIDRIPYNTNPKGVGGFGTVHQGIETNICVKVMQKKALAAWARELIVWAHSWHPNLLPFTGVFFEDVDGIPHICLVSPFMKNGNLHDYAPRISQPGRIPLLRDVADGLLYIHQIGIVHGDLKPQNVLVNSRGRAMIADFGSSRVAAGASTTAPAKSSYTLCFGAPEVIAHGKQPTKMSDVWSFGCISYEALSRKPPYYQYPRTQIISILDRKLPPKRPGAAVEQGLDQYPDTQDDQDFDEVNDQLWELVSLCCVPEPEDRSSLLTIKGLLANMIESLGNEIASQSATEPSVTVSGGPLIGGVITPDELRTALEEVKREDPPVDLAERETYFMNLINRGESLVEQGHEFYLPAAIAFYKALVVYPYPEELIIIYSKTAPEPLLKIIMALASLDGSPPTSPTFGMKGKAKAKEGDETGSSRSRPLSEPPFLD
ncbi:hypothetical protein NP233_g2270 [Leucocoprinus birnbaumii]|uniref:Protein kinase domain-containing protein n=1 Tax=Leucocoprinus birnbaumii TaxID=56174 RepID=A0AAD5YXD9_9AGAR|nr:hypothetical protein NP233_g2270 [Leucocoprinus birnbaumii]